MLFAGYFLVFGVHLILVTIGCALFWLFTWDSVTIIRVFTEQIILVEDFKIINGVAVIVGLLFMFGTFTDDNKYYK